MIIATVKKCESGSCNGFHGNRYISEPQPENVKYSSKTNILFDKVKCEQMLRFKNKVKHFHRVSTCLPKDTHTTT